MAIFDSDNEKIVAQPLRPKDAATLVLVKRDGDVPRVLMGLRPGSMAFMANKYVFPGGRLDPGDLRIKSASELLSPCAPASVRRGRAGWRWRRSARPSRRPAC